MMYEHQIDGCASKSLCRRHDRVFDLIHKVAAAGEGVKPSRGGAFRLASALVCDNKIISIGVNSRKTHPLQMRFSKNDEAIELHAEIDAIVKAPYGTDFSRCSLYILRLKKRGNAMVRGLAHPCSGCLRAITNFGIKRVFYTTNEPDYASFE